MKIKKSILSKINNKQYWKCFNQDIFNDFKEKKLFLKNVIFKKIFFENFDKNLNLYYIYNNFNLKVMVLVKESNKIAEFYTPLQFYLEYNTFHFKKEVFNTYIVFYNEEFKLSDKNFECRFIDDYIIRICKIFNIKLHKKIEIYVLERKNFEKIFNSSNVTGFFDQIKSKIYVDDIDLYIAHELIHAIFNNYKKRLNIFINEGLAEAFKKPLNIDCLMEKNSFSFSDIYFNSIDELTVEKYALSGMFFRYIYCVYGLDILSQVINIQDNDLDLFKNKLEIILDDKFFENNFNLWFFNLNLDDVDWFFKGDI